MALLFFGIGIKLTFSSPVATAEVSKFADILSAALSQHHLSGCLALGECTHHHDYLGREDLFLYRSSGYSWVSLTLDYGYLFTAAPAKCSRLLLTLDEVVLLDFERGVAPLGPSGPTHPLLLGCGVIPLGHRP